MKGKEITEPQIRWLVGEGNISFWHDLWWSSTKIGEEVMVPAELYTLTAKDALNQPDLWVNCCTGKFGGDDIEDIKNSKLLLNREADSCVWSSKSSGNFSIKAAWNLCRQKITVSLKMCGTN